ncbi:MAG: hypothetical protein FJ295_17920, partial [Planctomycetes bacterium]|nr:hypothetical protein [Planctomycetota bacterium]
MSGTRRWLPWWLKLVVGGLLIGLLAARDRAGLAVAQEDPAAEQRPNQDAPPPPPEPGAEQPALAAPLPAPAARGQEPGEGDEELEVLARGPVHEAFAEPIVFDAEPGPVVPKPPPEPIDEIPPDQRPDGENVEWISGYWAWDDERTEFLWISGFWRVMPPGRRWVPGYWAESDGGHQWVSGFWAAANQPQITYLPPPPASLDVGPSTPSPATDQFWVPGCWKWRGSSYAWRAGYWTDSRPDWIWVPAYYVWTPNGCLFVDGYWDYVPVRRGLLFAPVYFRSTVWRRPNYVYCPSVVVDCNRLTNHFFVFPRWRHYYYGDYYASNYATMGIYPWFSFHERRGCYDPIYNYYRRHHFDDRDWDRNLRAAYDHRRDHAEARPFGGALPLTAAVGAAAIATHAAGNSQLLPLHQVAKIQDSPVRLQSLEDQRRQELREQSKKIREFSRQRGELEAKSPSLKGDLKNLPKELPKIDLPQTVRTPRGGPTAEAERTTTRKRDRADFLGDDFRGKARIDAANQKGNQNAGSKPGLSDSGSDLNPVPGRQLPAADPLADRNLPKSDAPKGDGPKTGRTRPDPADNKETEQPVPRGRDPRSDPPTPRTKLPKTDGGNANPPRDEKPRTDPPRAESPRADAPRADAPRADAPRAEARRADA